METVYQVDEFLAIKIGWRQWVPIDIWQQLCLESRCRWSCRCWVFSPTSAGSVNSTRLPWGMSRAFCPIGAPFISSLPHLRNTCSFDNTCSLSNSFRNNSFLSGDYIRRVVHYMFESDFGTPLRRTIHFYVEALFN